MMKTEPDPSGRSGPGVANNTGGGGGGGGKPLLYSKALSSSLPPPPQSVAPPPTCSPHPPPPTQQQGPGQAGGPPHHLQHAPPQNVMPNQHTGKQNTYRSNGGRGQGKHNGDGNNHRGQPKYWNNNGGNANEGGDQRDQSPQFIGSPNGNPQYGGSHSGVPMGGGGDLGGGGGGRKSANGVGSYGYHNEGYGHQHPQQHHNNNYNNNNNGGQNAYNGQRNDGSRQGGSRDYEISTTNLYICGLKPETRDEDLKILCSPYGAISTTKAIMDRATNTCRGFGFVDFEEPYSAVIAMDSLKHQGVQAQMARCPDGKRQKVNVVNTPSEHDPTNLYIANLPAQMYEKDLEAMLSAYGNVTSTRVLKDDHGVSRCVGFARMETREMCDHIIRVFKDKVLPGSNEILTVKYADGGSKRKVFKNNGARYQNDDQSQRSLNDNGSMATNGVSQMMPNQLNGAAGFPNMAPYGAPFMGMQMGMHPAAVAGSQYAQQGAPAAGQQLYGPQAAAAAAAQMAYGQMTNDPNAMQMHLSNLMSQMSIHNYPFNPYSMYGMPTAQPQVPANVEADPNVQGTLDGQQVAGGAEGQPVQADGFVHGPPQQPSNQAQMAAAMLYSQQAQN